MDTIQTKYGGLSGVEFRSFYSNGRTDGCLVTRPNTLVTPYGTLVPQYEAEDMGRRPVKPMYFYKSGALKAIALQAQTVLATPVGDIPAELVTFYESGSIRRIFPLDGKLSGFWSWQKEFALATPITFSSPVGLLSAKLIGIQLYESGALKSVTLWPGQALPIQTPLGEIMARKGLAFYASGAIRSFEPLSRIPVPTPIGRLTAFDNDPNGIHGDVNSLQLAEDGSVEELCTVDHAIHVTTGEGREELFQPGLKGSLCGDERKVSVPMRLRFGQGRVIFHGRPECSFDLQDCRFDVRKVETLTKEPAYACS